MKKRGDIVGHYRIELSFKLTTLLNDPERRFDATWDSATCCHVKPLYLFYSFPNNSLIRAVISFSPDFKAAISSLIPIISEADNVT